MLACNFVAQSAHVWTDLQASLANTTVTIRLRQAEDWGRFLGVAVPMQPFPPPQNEGASVMLRQLLRFWWHHPLAALGLREYDHRDRPLDLQAL